MKVALTGATGFLGRYLVDALLARGWSVVGVARDPDRVPGLRDRIGLRRADLLEPDTLVAALEGVDALVSNAALFSLSEGSPAAYARVNVEGTKNLLAAAREVGLRRLVHVSSVAVYKGLPFFPADERHAQWSERDRPSRFTAYAISKALSEQECWRSCARDGIALTTVRPSAIYGAFDPNFTRVLRRWLAWPIVPAPVLARLPFVYAGDVAEAVAECLARPSSVGRAYNVAGEPCSPRALAQAFYAAGGGPERPLVPVPLPLFRRFDSAAAARELGFHNRPLVEGFRDLLARERAAGPSRML
ncbi:MAG: NAD-dependent epimerase/dehydratase family protein [Myxococcales bacterium]|nr:NAD-dependent epimerase/dehydratase family protein [Myxococcales bacterium]